MDMIEKPQIVTHTDGRLTVFGTKRLKTRPDYSFWGWMLLVVVAFVILFDVQRWRLDADFWDYMLPLTGGVVGVSLVRYSRGSTTKIQQPLLRISSDRNHVAGVDPQGQSLQSISTDDLTHVVFGVIDVPLETRRGVNLEACAVYLACQDGTPVPVIPACEDKPGTFKLARALSTALNLPIIELGRGITG